MSRPLPKRSVRDSAGRSPRMFLDPSGPNYRHEIAHGAADPAEDASPFALLTALAILSVAVRLAIVRQRPPTGGDDAAAEAG